MPTVEERLASLEARVDAMSDMRNLITELRGDMNARFIDVTDRFTELREDVNRRFDEVNGRLVVLDQKSDRQFTWMVSTQMALLLAVIGGLVTAYFQ